jgi:hypothetical protein
VLASAAALGLLVSGVAAGSAPARGATYSGTTSRPEENEVSFRVASNAKRLLDFATRLGYNGKCGQGGGPNFVVRLDSMSLRRDGSFSGETTATLGQFKATIEISGRITGRSASGSVERTPATRCVGPPNEGANDYRETFTARAG